MYLHDDADDGLAFTLVPEPLRKMLGVKRDYR